MSQRKRNVTRTINELQQKHTQIIDNQFHQVEIFQNELDAINAELKTIRLLMPQMRSPKTRNMLANRQQKLIELGLKLNESLTILYMAALQPLFQMAKIIESDSKPNEIEAPPAQPSRISDDDLKAMYQKYED